MGWRQWFRPRDAVAVRLEGGLGNQMFQYAAGWVAARCSGCRLVLDGSGLNDPGLRVKRPYGLDAWRIEGELDALGAFALRACVPLRESDAVQPERLRTAPRGCRLLGYWQSERYFAHERKALLQQFQLAKPPAAYVQHLAAAIAAAPASASVHVRRGDYVHDPVAARVHGGCCGPDYYRRCLDALRMRHPDLTVFAFSDDPAWVASNLDAPAGTVVVDSAQSSAAEDIWLMSLCRHHVVANSSFSWWGAWLSRQEGTTFAPRRWYADPSVPERDVVPANWSRL